MNSRIFTITLLIIVPLAFFLSLLAYFGYSADEIKIQTINEDQYFIVTGYTIIDTLDYEIKLKFTPQIMNVTWYEKNPDNYTKIELQYYQISEPIKFYDEEVAKTLQYHDDLTRPIIEMQSNQTKLWVEFDLSNDMLLDVNKLLKINQRIQSVQWDDADNDHIYNHLFEVDIDGFKEQFNKYDGAIMPATRLAVPVFLRADIMEQDNCYYYKDGDEWKINFCVVENEK